MVHRFGTFEFDDGSGELWREGRRVALEPQPARALAALLARAGDVVSLEDLGEAMWAKETHVDFDRGLAYVISQIRSALGDSADNPRFVQTLPRKGYRFIAPVQPARDAPSATTAPDLRIPPLPPEAPGERAVRWLAAALALVIVISIGWMVASRHLRTPPQVTVAVSIFDNETGLEEHDRLVAGLNDLVVTRLTEIAPSRLAIVGNAAVLRQPRNIRNLAAVREQLEADYVLLGQLQRADTGLRFITHFIRMADEAHLKANRLSYPDGDLSLLERDVVQEFELAVRQHILTPAAK
jgi:DNA-binding winged helix-turn-helix (wHTH) protein/TolB-like protein